ncbi:MAG TPA: RNA polymerase sigma factor [Ignavibacteria bacterium]|nr:RNA polymerase sigma factor [Ignavibacteria bacterium]
MNEINGNEDYILIKEAVNGSKPALESLVRKYQNDIYNIALKMVYYPDDALDITQEVLIKVITNLSSFRFESRFSTWLYRITVNHILNIKKIKAENILYSDFKVYGEAIDKTPDIQIDTNSTEMKIIVEEVKLTCLQGMLMCLDRKQRVAFVLGSIFAFPDTVCSEVMEISRNNFRQILSRARKDLGSFMSNKCGLIRKTNPCHCSKKTKSLIERGAVNPGNLLFNKDFTHSIESSARERLKSLDNFIEDDGGAIFRKMPYNEMSDFTLKIREILDSSRIKSIFNFN